MKQVSLIGLGAMGSGMARCLAGAGFKVLGYDRDPRQTAAIPEITACDHLEAAFRETDVVFLSLPSPEITETVFTTLLAQASSDARPDVVDLGTLPPAKGREWGQRFQKAGFDFLEAPVTGGPGGAASGKLRAFIGGPRACFERLEPAFSAIAEDAFLCGDWGAGSLVKGVNQLGMGLVQAAVLEAVSLGVNSGLDPEDLARWVGSEAPNSGWRFQIYHAAKAAAEGRADQFGVKSGQLEYYLSEASAQDFPMPMTAGLHDFLKDVEPWIKEANRPSASYWKELRQGRETFGRGKEAAG